MSLTPRQPTYEELEELIGELRQQLMKRDQRIAELERLVEELRRGGKRQSAPFSKGTAKSNPKRPGRKAGKAYGRQATRAVPGKVDRRGGGQVPPFRPALDGRCWGWGGRG